MVPFHLLLLISVRYTISSKKYPLCVISLFFSETPLMPIFGHTYIFREHNTSQMEQHPWVEVFHETSLPTAKISSGRKWISLFALKDKMLWCVKEWSWPRRLSNVIKSQDRNNKINTGGMSSQQQSNSSNWEPG